MRYENQKKHKNHSLCSSSSSAMAEESSFDSSLPFFFLFLGNLGKFFFLWPLKDLDLPLKFLDFEASLCKSNCFFVKTLSFLPSYDKISLDSSSLEYDFKKASHSGIVLNSTKTVPLNFLFL